MQFIFSIALLILYVVSFARQNLQSSKRIFKGSIVEPNSAPYQVGLLVVNKNITHLCGGSLINPQFVLTAAHCVKNVSVESINVIIGRNSLEKALKIEYPVDAINYKTHEQWNSTTRQNDIAIIALRNPVELSDEIAILSLPTELDPSSLVDQYGRLTGWGRTLDMPGHNKNLMELKVRIVSNEECQLFRMDSTKLCGYGEDEGSACRGDSGGPLVLDNTDIQIGIVSFGSKKGCTVGLPHVYTNVASYLDWINESINSLSIISD